MPLNIKIEDAQDELGMIDGEDENESSQESMAATKNEKVSHASDRSKHANYLMNALEPMRDGKTRKKGDWFLIKERNEMGGVYTEKLADIRHFLKSTTKMSSVIEKGTLDRTKVQKIGTPFNIELDEDFEAELTYKQYKLNHDTLVSLGISVCAACSGKNKYGSNIYKVFNTLSDLPELI